MPPDVARLPGLRRDVPGRRAASPGSPARRTSPASAGSGTATTWPATEEDEATFRVKTGVDPRDLAGQLVLDAGCGGGRYARLAGQARGAGRRRRPERGRREGRRALRRPARRRDRPGRPARPAPGRGRVRPGLLDRRAAPQPRPAPGVRPGRRAGQAGRPAGGLALPQEHAAPGVAQLRPPRRDHPPARRACSSRSASAWACSAASRSLNRTLNKVANFSNHPDWTLRVCDNFDWYAPRYQSHHTVDELTALVRRGGVRRPRRARPRQSRPALRLGLPPRPDHRQRRQRGGDPRVEAIALREGITWDRSPEPAKSRTDSLHRRPRNRPLPCAKGIAKLGGMRRERLWIGRRGSRPAEFEFMSRSTSPALRSGDISHATPDLDRACLS